MPLGDFVEATYELLKSKEAAGRVDPRVYGERVLARLLPAEQQDFAKSYYQFLAEADTLADDTI
jgi:hypothetical protein